MERFISAAGVAAMVFIAWLISYDRRSFPWRVVLWGTALQLIFALIILGTRPGEVAFDWLARQITAFLSFTRYGTEFLFGNIVKPEHRDTFGAQFAFGILPTIIFFSSIMSLAYYFGVMQRVVEAIAKVMSKTMGTSGAESLCAAANIFVGQSEAPLMIKPYMPTTTNSELVAVMIGGFATIAGGVLAIYISFGIPAQHILAACVMSAPAALIMAKVILPEKGEPLTKDTVKMPVEKNASNMIEAAAIGAGDGLRLALNVGAMLIAFIALIEVINALMGLLHQGLAAIHFPYFPEKLSVLFGWIFSPLALLLGVPWKDCLEFGNLLGIQISINEFVAYLRLAELIKSGGISERTAIIATYAICGFANFSSIAMSLRRNAAATSPDLECAPCSAACLPVV